MLDTLLASDIADVDHALDTIAKINESAEVRQICDRSLDDRSDWILRLRILPRITECLLETERNPLFRRVDAEHDDFNLITDLHDIARFADLLRPRHLRDVNEPVNTGREVNKSA